MKKLNSFSFKFKCTWVLIGIFAFSLTEIFANNPYIFISDTTLEYGNACSNKYITHTLVNSMQPSQVMHNKLKSVIVEFKGDALVTAYQKSGNTKSYNTIHKNLKNEHETMFANFEKDLNNIYQTKSKAIKASLSKPKYGTKHTLAFLGQEVTLDSLAIRGIEKLLYVKKVHENRTVKANLNIAVPQIHADQVWFEMNCQGDSVRVGILDTGIDYTHPDLGEGFGSGYKVIGGYDFVDDDDDPADLNGHGTHVAGIVAADGILKGVAPKALLYAIRVLDKNGSGWADDIISGIEYALDPNNDGNLNDKLDILNISLGGYDSQGEDPMEIAVKNASNSGLTCVVAAGNDGEWGMESIGSPGTVTQAITVGAQNPELGIAYYSSIGPSLLSDRIKPDLVAPGEINSTIPGNEYATHMGTSMATPMVAGTCALLKKLHPEWSPLQIKATLMSTSVDLNEPHIEQGAGMLNAINAVRCETLIDSAMLQFGTDNLPNDSIYRNQQTITVTNTGSSSVDYQIQEGRMPVGVNITFDPESFSLNSGGSQTIVLNLEANNALLQSTNSEKYPFLDLRTGSIDIVNPDETLQVLWSFSRGYKMEVITDAPIMNLIIYNDEGYFYEYFRPISYKFKVPNKFYCIAEMARDSFYIHDWDEYVHMLPSHIIVKEVNLEGGDTTIDFRLDQAKNRVIFNTEDENGERYTDNLQKIMNFSLILDEYMSFTHNREVLNLCDDEGYLYSSGYSLDNYKWIDYFDFQVIANSYNPNSYPVFDTLYISDIPESIQVVAAEIRVHDTDRLSFCFNSTQSQWGLTGDLDIKTESEDYRHIAIQTDISSTDFVDIKAKLYRNDEKLISSLIYGTTCLTLPYEFDVYMPSATTAPDGLFYAFAPQKNFSRKLGPLQCVNNEFFFGDKITPITRVWQEHDTIKDARTPQFLQSEFNFVKNWGLSTYKTMNGDLYKKDIPMSRITDINGNLVGIPLPNWYRYSINNYACKVYAKNGRTHANITIDRTAEFAEAPTLTSFQLFNGSGDRFEILEKGDSVRIQFSLAEFEYYATYEKLYRAIEPDSVQLYGRADGSSAWEEIEITNIAQDTTIGLIFEGVYKNIVTDSGYYQLKLHAANRSGNVMEQEFKPAFFVSNIQYPIAHNDSLVTMCNRSFDLSRRLVDNDINPNGSNYALKVNIVTQPQHGRLEPSFNGFWNDYTYFVEGYSGIDEFSYTVSNKNYTSNIATVMLNILPTTPIEEIVEESNSTSMFIYPNPVTDEMNISLNIPETGNIRLEAYNIQGQLVKVLLDKKLDAGTHELKYNVQKTNHRQVDTGICLIKATTKNNVITKKVFVK